MIQIGLHSGGRMRVDSQAADVSDVTPEDLAYGLSYVTRFGGMAGPYSVAEHSVRMFDWAKKEGQDKAILRAILLHDAPECLGEGDHQRFVKRVFFGDGPHKYADLVCSALWEKFVPADRPVLDWSWHIVHTTLKFYDNWMGPLEARAFGFPHDLVPDWLDCTYVPPASPGLRWSAADAIEQFTTRWHNCE